MSSKRRTSHSSALEALLRRAETPPGVSRDGGIRRLGLRRARGGRPDLQRAPDSAGLEKRAHGSRPRRLSDRGDSVVGVRHYSGRRSTHGSRRGARTRRASLRSLHGPGGPRERWLSWAASCFSRRPGRPPIDSDGSSTRRRGPRMRWRIRGGRTSCSHSGTGRTLPKQEHWPRKLLQDWPGNCAAGSRCAWCPTLHLRGPCTIRRSSVRSSRRWKSVCRWPVPGG